MIQALDIEGIEQSWGWMRRCQSGASLDGLPTLNCVDGTIDHQASAEAIRRYAATQREAGRISTEIYDIHSTITAGEVEMIIRATHAGGQRRARIWRWFAVASLLIPFLVALYDETTSSDIPECAFFFILAVFFWLQSMIETASTDRR